MKQLLFTLLLMGGIAALLPDMAAQSGAKNRRFSLMSPQETGVNFVNEIRDEKTRNVLIYANYYGGAGVGIGDFNNDGLQDLFFAGNMVQDRLYLNKGNFQFEDITLPAGILAHEGWATSVVLADVNNDGWLDIYLTCELYDDRPDLRRNLLYINQGDLTFMEQAEAYGVADDQRTRHATFFDYDKDGDLDLFLLNQPPNPGNYSDFFGSDLKKPEFSPRLYRQDAGADHPVFTDVTEAAGLLRPGFPNSVSASDFNGDGWPDLYVANDFEAPDFLYLNNGNGTFTYASDEALKHISFYSMGVDAADINNDGWLDVMVVDMVAEDNYRLKANMSGMNPQTFWDVLNEGGHYQYMFNTLQLNNGTTPSLPLSFSETGQLAGMPNTDWSWSNLIADFDNDGWKDVFITNGLLRDIRNSDASREFPKYVTQVINNYIQKHPNNPNVSIWDILDLDKALSLVPSVPLSNYAYRNNGDLTFTKVMADWGLDRATFSNGAAYADLDNDGYLDLVVSNINEVAHLYRNNGAALDGNRYLRVKLRSDQPVFGATARIEYGDEQQFLELTNVRGIYSTSENYFHFGLGKRDRVERLTITWPDGRQTRVENVAANQVLELSSVDAQPATGAIADHQPLFHDAGQETGIQFRHRENKFDDYAREVLLPHQMSRFGPALATGDVNGDGLEDFFVGGASGFMGELHLQKPSGLFEPSPSSPWWAHRTSEDLGAVFFDADQDGDLDLYVVSGGNEFDPGAPQHQDRLYLNDGKGEFSAAPDRLPVITGSGSRVIPFDLDGDGDLDLFVGGRQVPGRYPEPAQSYLLRNDGGTFVDISPAYFATLGMVTDATPMDFDGDGRTDLVVVGEWMPVTFLRNTGGSLENASESFGTADRRGWWFSVESADMDGDGDLDLIIGNLGLNYKYKATPSEPFDVHYSDFDKNGSMDIVLGYYNFGEHFPLRGRSCSSQQVPVIKEKFPTYDLFSSATIDEVYGAKALKQALHYEVTSFASVYAENLGGGRFDFRALPNEAQIAPINDILTGDFDRDGHMDLVVAGNLYVSEIETPRADAGIGLFLRGDGKGGFTPVPARESGLFLPYDVKALELIDSPQGQLILSGNNNDFLRVTQIRPEYGDRKP